MFKLNIFLIQKNYNDEKKELIINNYKEGININSEYNKSVYNMKNGKLTGEYVFLYDNDYHINLKLYYINGKLTNEYGRRYENIQTLRKYFYKNHKL